MNPTFYINKRRLPTQALEKACRVILYILVTTLVFEGLVRKLSPPVVSGAIFFIKDLICIFGLFIVYNKYCSLWVFDIKQKWVSLILAFIPLLIFTAVLDPILALFATKQYLLYPVVLLLLQYGFFQNNFAKLKAFLFYFSFLILPTTIIAILQNSLPSTHWLNLGVNGNSLIAFSAAGFLRVSSTFSFTGQYSWYLNVSCPIIVSYIAITVYQAKKISLINWFFWFTLATSYTIAIFITGGRTAVLGGGAVIAGGLCCLLIRQPQWVLGKGAFFVVLGVILLGVLREYKPEYFAAYEARSSGSQTETHEEEIQQRITGDFTGWTQWFWEQPFPNIVMGNGLGVMSNGSEQVSKYAKSIRNEGFWTESDTPTTFWEGGLYLAFIWYLFRFFVIFLCFKVFMSLENKQLIFGGAFLFSFIAINGIMGTLAIQPPIAIWWWIAIGVLLCIQFTELSSLSAEHRNLTKKTKSLYATHLTSFILVPLISIFQSFRDY